MALDADGVRNRAALAFIAYQQGLGDESLITAEVDAEQLPAKSDRDKTNSLSDGASALSAVNSDSIAQVGLKEHKIHLIFRRTLPILLLVVGIALAPLVFWAPLVGGLSAALIWLQTGELQSWVAMVPEDAESPHQQEAVESPCGFIQERGGKQSRGLLLVAFLLLLSVQALMLIITVNVGSPKSGVLIWPEGEVQRSRSELLQQVHSNHMQLGTPESRAQSSQSRVLEEDGKGPSRFDQGKDHE